MASTWRTAGLTEDLADLRIVGIDGSGPRVLYRNPDVTWPHVTDWSSDGRHILAVLSPKGQDRIALIAVGDGAVRVIGPLRQVRSIVHVFRRMAAMSRTTLRLRRARATTTSSCSQWNRGGRSPWSVTPLMIVLSIGRRTARRFCSAATVPGPMVPGCFAWPTGLLRGRRSWSSRVSAPGFRPMGFTRQGSYYYGVDTPSADVYVADGFRNRKSHGASGCGHPALRRLQHPTRLVIRRSSPPLPLAHREHRRLGCQSAVCAFQ